jgi:hypothetical protein
MSFRRATARRNLVKCQVTTCQRTRFLSVVRPIVARHCEERSNGLKDNYTLCITAFHTGDCFVKSGNTHSIPRMKLNDRTFQILPVQVGIDLCGGNTFMAQHFLHGAQVGAAFYQMGGKRMPESMRTDSFFNPG